MTVHCQICVSGQCVCLCVCLFVCLCVSVSVSVCVCAFCLRLPFLGHQERPPQSLWVGVWGDWPKPGRPAARGGFPGHRRLGPRLAENAAPRLFWSEVPEGMGEVAGVCGGVGAGGGEVFVPFVFPVIFPCPRSSGKCSWRDR